MNREALQLSGRLALRPKEAAKSLERGFSEGASISIRNTPARWVAFSGKKRRQRGPSQVQRRDLEATEHAAQAPPDRGAHESVQLELFGEGE